MLYSLVLPITSLAVGGVNIFVIHPVYMTFRPRSNALPDPNFSLNNEKINNVDQHQYLGIVISKSLSNVPDIKRCETKFFRQFYSFYRKFSYLDPSILLFLFRSLCSTNNLYNKFIKACKPTTDGESKAISSA